MYRSDDWFWRAFLEAQDPCPSGKLQHESMTWWQAPAERTADSPNRDHGSVAVWHLFCFTHCAGLALLTCSSWLNVESALEITDSYSKLTSLSCKGMHTLYDVRWKHATDLMVLNGKRSAQVFLPNIWSGVIYIILTATGLCSVRLTEDMPIFR